MPAVPFFSTDGAEPEYLGIGKPTGTVMGAPADADPVKLAFFNIDEAVLQPSIGDAGTNSGNSIVSLPLSLANVTASDIVTGYLPGFAFRIVKLAWVTLVAVTTSGKAATITPKIGSTATTGGVLALTSANCTPHGAVVNASAITGANTGSETDTITLTASAVTAFAEGSGTLLLTLQDVNTGSIAEALLTLNLVNAD